MTSFEVELKELTVRYHGVTAIDRVTAKIVPGAITGLIGRNGSGKSSLLSVIAAFRKPSGGMIHVNGQSPYENGRLTSGICLIREGGDFGSDRVHEILALASASREGWSGELADRLLETFNLPPKRRVDSLSRGQRAALGAVVGLASRSPLTMLDEVYLGMDAPTRYAFYDALLADYAEHPRTIVISSHLIEEVERLFEYVLVLHEGRLLLQNSAEALRSGGVTVIGEVEAVDRFVAPYTVLKRRSLGRTVAASIYADLTPEARHVAAATGLEIEGLSVQDLFVYLTDEHMGAADGARTDEQTGAIR